MIPSIRLVVLVSLVCVSGVDSSVADYLVVARNATVKTGPAGSAAILENVVAGRELALVSTTQTSGYYEVALSGAGGDRGWIYRTLVRRFPGNAPSLNLPGGTGVSVAELRFPAVSHRLEVHVINVGQGDAIYIRCPDGVHEMLIDSGELNSRYPGSADELKQYLVEHQGNRNPIEVVVTTHPHSDHMGNMDWVLDQFEVVRYVDNQNMGGSATFQRVEDAYYRAQARNGTEYWGAQEPVRPDVDFCPRTDVNAVVLRAPGFGHDNDPNNNSVIIRVDYGQDSFLFMGDAGEEEETALMNNPETAALLDCDFLKVGHHGSATSSGPGFLQRVTPVVSAISCGQRGVGTNAGHKHPRSEIVERLLSFAAPRPGPPVSVVAFSSVRREWKRIDLNRAVYVTSVEGDLVFESDGNGIVRRSAP